MNTDPDTHCVSGFVVPDGTEIVPCKVDHGLGRHRQEISMNEYHAFHPPERPPVPRRTARIVLAQRERWLRKTLAEKLRDAAQWLDPVWQTNPATQIEWGLEYIKERYGPLPDGTVASDQHDWDTSDGC